MSRRGAAAAGAALFAAVAMRVHNAFTYPYHWGFDAGENWRYIERLTRRWDLPEATAVWSAGDPPLFFYASGLLARALQAVGLFAWTPIAIRLGNALLGLAIAALAFLLVRRADPGDVRRAALAAGLVLFLPAHVHMSAMVNEEMLAAFLGSLALFALAAPGLPAETAGAGLRRAAGAGTAAGAAFLTKLTGGVVLAAGAATYAVEGAQRRLLHPALARGALFAAAGAAVGGWFYARNWLRYGWIQPFGLPAHELMFSMPPGARGWLDYLWIPPATFTDPQLLHPDLLRSVWGSLYATLWFDGHRFFLPTEGEGVARLGTLTLGLALVPTLACLWGVAQGARRVLRRPDGPDLPLLLLAVLALAGFALYTWQNPWFAVIKGTSLLSLCLPFAFYASGVLADWSRGRGGAFVWAALGALAVCVVLGCTFGLLFERTEVPGLPWRAGASP